MFKFIIKTLLWLIAIVLAIAIVAYLTVGYWLNPVVGRVVPMYTQTSAFLDSAEVSLLSGKVALKGLKIGNPSGFADPYVFELGEVSIQFQPKSVLTDKIIVDQVLIKGTKISTELNKQGQMNLMVLNNNVQSSLPKTSTSAPVKQEKGTPAPSAQPSKSVIIKELKIADTSVRFGVMGKMMTMPLPNIQERNIGEKKKTSIAETIGLIVNKLTVDSLAEMTKSGQKALNLALDKITEKTKNPALVKELSDVVSGLF